MYDLIKKPAIEFSVEICDDLGQLISDINQIQENLTHNMIEVSLATFKNNEGSFNGDKELSTRMIQFEK